MVGNNESFARADGKALTVMKLKELGSKAERDERRLYDAGEDSGIPLDRADATSPDSQPLAKVRLSVEEFWRLHFPDGFHINSMDPDGNCLFHSLWDQLNHNSRQAHGFTCHQTTNHIRQHSDEFKDFLLLQ